MRKYLQVAYAEKENAKKYGAQWDRDRKMWYYEGDTMPDNLKKYLSLWDRLTPNQEIIGGGEGYGYRGFSTGQILENAGRYKREKITAEYLYVVASSKKYYPEEGMTFGVGEEEGYYYTAIVRAATDEEAQETKKEKEIAVKKQKKLAEIENWKEEIIKTGIRPAGDNAIDGERILNTQDIYGGGDWWIIQTDKIWYIRNNGMDGDNWALNNIRTGGAGAIGYYIPYNEILAELLTTQEASNVKI